MHSPDDSVIDDNHQTPKDGSLDLAPVAESSISEEDKIKLPSVEEIFSKFAAPHSSLFPRGTETFSVEEQRNMFESLQAFVKKVQTEGFPELQDSMHREDQRGGYDVDSLDDARIVLAHLWTCNSEYLVQAAELLANQSRDSSWRIPYGQSGILDFFLRLTASREPVDQNLLLHSLRLIGNSCADTDENRACVVDGNYILPIIWHVHNPGISHVVIPVVYNICIDFAPTQSQAAANQLTYILLKLIKDGAIKGNEALLDFSCELIELTSQDSNAEQGIDQSPNGTILLLMELAVSEEVSFSQFSSLANSLAAYLQRSRFQNICISNRMVDRVLSVLERSFSFEEGRSSENIQSLVQLQLKVNQTLSELSDSPLFGEIYPLDSALTQKLKSWLTASEDQLQVCACVMLGNLAQSDDVCQRMIQELDIHTTLIPILKSDAKAVVLHSVLGFLKNLAIPHDNKLRLGDAGIIPALSHLWEYQMVPQVQFSAVSITRVVIPSVENISRLLALVSPDSEHQTYLSLLLSLFEKTDSIPIKTEVGRIVASICRTISLKTTAENSETESLLDRLYSLHEGAVRPVGDMITQTQWPVVQSEGWFALALIASNAQGCQSVVSCLQDSDVFRVLEETLSAESIEVADETDRLRMTKDRDNMAVLVQELLKNESGTLSPTWRDRMEGLMKHHVPRHLKSTRED